MWSSLPPQVLREMSALQCQQLKELKTAYAREAKSGCSLFWGTLQPKIALKETKNSILGQSAQGWPKKELEPASVDPWRTTFDGRGWEP